MQGADLGPPAPALSRPVVWCPKCLQNIQKLHELKKSGYLSRGWGPLISQYVFHLSEV